MVGEIFNWDSAIKSNWGGITENFEFKMDDDTEVYRSCSAALYGELFVFGGYTSAMNKRKQVSNLDSDFIWLKKVLKIT